MSITASPAQLGPDFVLMPYRPAGAALDLMRCRRPEILIEGPKGTGKTMAVIVKCHLLCQKYQGIRVLWTRYDRTRMNETILSLYEEQVLHKRRTDESTASRENRRKYTYTNHGGSQIVLGGLEEVDKFMSGEYDIIVVFEGTDEGIKEQMIDDLGGRLDRGQRGGTPRIPYNQLIIDCNPREEEHWLNQRANQTRTDEEDPLCGEPRMIRLLSRHEDNPSVTPQYLARLRALQGVDRQRNYEGKWCGGSGDMFFDGLLISRLRNDARAFAALHTPERGTMTAA